jgi:hypothetical protein
MIDRDASYYGSDADDDDSDTDSSPRRSMEPFAPFPPPVAFDKPLDRASTVPREQRSPRAASSGHESPTPSSSDGTKTRATRRTHSSSDEDVQNENITQEAEEALGSETDGGIPGGTSPPASPVPSSPDPESTIDDIQEAIFSNFDIEDLLYAGRIEVEPWLRLGIVLLRWKSRKNISTHAFDELRHDLARCLAIKVPSPKSILRHLQEIVGIYPVKVDCCVNRCLAYVGRYRRSKKCAICEHKRYQLDRSGDENVPDFDLDDSDLSDGATYDDDLDENHAVRSSCLVACGGIAIHPDENILTVERYRDGHPTNRFSTFL